MKWTCMIIFLSIACTNSVQQGTTVKTYPVIPSVTLRSGDPLLSLQNGTWLYKQKPFSGTIETFFASGALQGRQGFYAGKEEGLLETFYETGTKDTRRVFHNGEKDSVHTGWWPNGKLRFEYHFDNGIYQGDFKEWYENGQALKHIVYRQGKEQKGKGWRMNGKPYMSYEIRNGRIYGLINPNLCFSLKNEKGEFVKTVQ